MRTLTGLGAAAVLGLGTILLGADAPPGPDAETWRQTVDRAVQFLRTRQAADGSFSAERSLGVTGVVVTGLLQSGRITPQDPMAARALAHLESLINEQEGHIAGAKPRDQLKNYVTAVNLMALVAANNPKYKKVVADAAQYLKGLQWDEGEGKQPSDNFYGGAGYDSKSRPDLSNTQFFLDALKSAGIPQNDRAFQNAALFVSRCQNLPGEHNDQPWAGKIRDGSFIYSAAGPGETKGDPTPDGGLPGYGSMTYAGIKSMIYAGVDRHDPRVQAAWKWIREHYTVDENPGMPKSRNQQGLYYYYHTMAKTLDALGVDLVEDAQGVKHDWRKDITLALSKRQRPDGSWVNDQDRWMEGDPNLVTGYALMALSYCKPRE